MQIFQRSQEIFILHLFSTNLTRFLVILKQNLPSKIIGGDERSRTADPPLAKRMLYQLSYIPINFIHRFATATAGQSFFF